MALSRPPFSPERLRSLFEPSSVALIGASDKSSWSQLLNHGLEGRFPGSVHYVNPRSTEAHGRPTVASIAEIGEPVDVAIVVVPQSAALEVVRDAAAAGVKNVIMITSGFAEAGPEGVARQRELVDITVEHGIALIGPNTLGFASPGRNTYLFPGAALWSTSAGSVGFVAQSGATAGSLIGYSAAQGIGVSHVVATGNEAGVTLTEIAGYLVEDEATRAIALFIEGFRDPDHLITVAERALAVGKPIIALKVGRSELAARAAAAHTGAIVGDDRIIDALFRQLGVIRVDSLEALACTAALVARTGELRGNRLAVAGTSGGAVDIVADRCEHYGLELPPFAPQTLSALQEVLPTYGTPQNPLDTTGAFVTDPAQLPAILSALGNDPSTDLLVAQFAIPGKVSTPTLREGVRRSAATLASLQVPAVITHVLGDGLDDAQKECLDELGLPFAPGGLESVIAAVAGAARWAERRRDRLAAGRPSETIARRTDLPMRGAWSEEDARRLLAVNGIPVVPGLLVQDEDDAVAAAAEVGYPVALKVVSPELAHKTDVGGVELDIREADAVRRAYRNVLDAVGTLEAAPRVDGVLVTPMRRQGVDLLLGVVRDADWGQVLAVGSGGIWAEILDDVSLRLLPVTSHDVRAMLEELRSAPILRGARGGAPADLEALVAAICAFAGLAYALRDDLETIEINPLRVDGSRIEALDALVTWQREH